MVEGAEATVLLGTRIVSLALNLPGPAALMRLAQRGASCVKVVPPAGDPMALYSPGAYEELHRHVRVVTADLKTDDGRAALAAELAHARVLLTSFRPSALQKLGLDWPQLSAQYPRLACVRITGGRGAAAEVPGHDLTYLADNGLVSSRLPATLFADMAGSLAAAEAVMSALYAQERGHRPMCIDVALDEAAQWLALPRTWGLTQPDGMVGGAHAGYRVYRCRGGKAAVAALEPHFARRLLEVAGVVADDCRDQAAHEGLKSFFAARTCGEVRALATEHDLPISVIAP
jgi:alpha-methylacyl-CoA racemase